MDFVIPGPPQGKARPRFSGRSGTVYTPAKTVLRINETRIKNMGVKGRLKELFDKSS